MTQIAIQAQVDAIKKVTKEALKSKEKALKFLIDAGILQEDGQSNSSKEKKVIKKK